MLLKFGTLNITELFWFVWFQVQHARGSTNSQRKWLNEQVAPTSTIVARAIHFQLIRGH